MYGYFFKYIFSLNNLGEESRRDTEEIRYELFKLDNGIINVTLFLVLLYSILEIFQNKM